MSPWCVSDTPEITFLRHGTKALGRRLPRSLPRGFLFHRGGRLPEMVRSRLVSIRPIGHSGQLQPRSNTRSKSPDSVSRALCFLCRAVAASRANLARLALRLTLRALCTTTAGQTGRLQRGFGDHQSVRQRRLEFLPGPKKTMEKILPKIAQLVAAARTELKRLGIDTDGKRSDELLTMAREERNRTPRAKPE